MGSATQFNVVAPRKLMYQYPPYPCYTSLIAWFLRKMFSTIEVNEDEEILLTTLGRVSGYFQPCQVYSYKK